MAWNKPAEKKQGDFIKLEDGANRVRIVSQPVEAWEHFMHQGGKVTVVECTGRGCEACAQATTPDDKAGHKYHFAAISRNEQLKNKKEDGTFPPGMVKLLSVGKTVYEQLYDLMNSEDWRFDDVPDYDVTINRSGTGKGTRYTVAPCPKRPLNEADAESVKIAKSIEAMVKDRYNIDMNGEPKTGYVEPGEPTINPDDIPF